MEIANFKAINKGILLAAFDVVFPKWGNFTIHDCKLFKKDEKSWIAFPGIPFEKEGKTMYKKVLSFDDETYQRVQRTLKNLALDEMQKQKPAQRSPDPLSPGLFDLPDEEPLPF